MKINAVSFSIGPFWILGFIFLTLKLCSVINWSWWWVTLPFWGGFSIVFAIFGFGALIAAFLALISAFISRR